MMAVLLTIPMHLMSSKFIKNAMMEKSVEITKINNNIAKMILEQKADILHNIIHDMEFLFSSKLSSYIDGDIEKFETEITKLYDDSFAQDVDVFFFQSVDGKYIFDASTPFYDTSMIRNYMMANGRFLRKGIRTIQSESADGTLIALTGSSEAVYEKTGELAGYFYTGVILNNASNLINEIMQYTNLSEAAIIFGDSIVAGNTERMGNNIIKTCYNTNTAILSGSSVTYCSDLHLPNDSITLKFYQSLPDTFLQNIASQNRKMGYTAIAIVLVVTLLSGYAINVITVRTLYRLVDYTHLMLSGKPATYNYTIISEFNMLADQISTISSNLSETQAYMKNLINNASAPIAVWDKNGNITLFNKALEHLSGFTGESVLGKHLSHIYSIFPQATVSVDNNKEEGTHSTQFESTITNKSSGEINFILWNITDVYSKGDYYGTILQGINITETKKAEEKMLLASKVVENTLDGILIVNPEGEIISCNASFCNMTGYTEDETMGKHVSMLRPDDFSQTFYRKLWEDLFKYGKWSGEYPVRLKNGKNMDSIMTVSSIRNSTGDITDFISVIHDMTERKKHEKEIKYQATHDNLTGLPNRIFFAEEASKYIETFDPIGGGLSVLFLDLDRFKTLNDTLGHTTGDKVLQIVSERIKNIICEETVAARFSGDEFTVMFTNVKDRDDALSRAKSIVAKISEPVSVQGYELFIQCSGGLCFYPENGKTASELIKNAEIAMYQAKLQGRNNIQQFTGGLDESLRERLILESKLNRAIENNELSLYYQPKIDLSNDSVMGMEALIRWNNPDLGFVPPDKFIPISEENGLILPIGDWVINKALEDTARLHREGFTNLKVAVNLSLRQFMKKDIVQHIREAINASGIENFSFEFEITENIFTEDLSTITKVMNEISSLNIKFAIDDFGTGYSSIGYLKKMPISTLKIDRSYINSIDTDPDNESIVSSVILMSKSLGLNIVAEGAETEEQVQILKEMGCNIVQGYYYGRPMPYDEFLEFVRKWEESPLS
jgi:diguanylate cyclase (GGDEF)-like protein/PAS domain S-box-containing protein